jgi:hypothetical protein
MARLTAWSKASIVSGFINAAANSDAPDMTATVTA